MGRVEINRAAVHQAYRQHAAPEWQQKTGEAMQSAVGAAMPLVTGFMRVALDTQPITHPNGDPGVRLIGRADYTEFVDQGTGLYGPLKQWITPKRAKYLSWVGPTGGRVFAKRTRGQPGQHFFARGLRAIFTRVEERPQ